MEHMTRLLLKGIHYTYSDGTEAISGIDIEIARGEFAGILGYNGSGKTTLLKIMDGLIKDIQGSVLLDGENIRNLAPREIYKKNGKSSSRIPTISFLPPRYSRMWPSVR